MLGKCRYCEGQGCDRCNGGWVGFPSGSVGKVPRTVEAEKQHEPLIVGFQKWLKQTYPGWLGEVQLREIEIAFISGVHWLNTCESYDPKQVLDECRSRLRELGMLP